MVMACSHMGLCSCLMAWHYFIAGSVSETAGTPLASGSRVALSKPLPVDAESSKDKEHHATDVELKSMEWGTLLADVYPLIKIMEVQVRHT